MALYANPRQATGGQIHALLIGAAAYPVDADQQPSLKLNPLPAIEKSTTSLADWLIRNSGDLILPVGSVELLMASEQADWRWQGQACAPPTRAEMDKAVQRWIARCEGDAPGSIALAYFGGHGFFRNRLHFFASDAANYADPAAESVRLDDFVVGMSTTNCSRQIFIFDCCQDLPDAIKNSLVDTGGTALVRANRPVQQTECLTIKAASPGLKAYADDETYLMKTLLQVLDNDGGDYFNGNWWVTPSSILQTINQVGKARYAADWSRASVDSNSSSLEQLRRLPEPPLVDVRIQTAPAKALPEAEIKLSDLATSQPALCESGEPCHWVQRNAGRIDAKVRSKLYVAEASFPPAEQRYRQTRSDPVWPKPFRDGQIVLDVDKGAG